MANPALVTRAPARPTGLPGGLALIAVYFEIRLWTNLLSAKALVRQLSDGGRPPGRTPDPTVTIAGTRVAAIARGSGPVRSKFAPRGDTRDR
jgi:hypothetical protein